MLDPLAGSTWSAAGTVAGFARAAPNQVLLGYARGEQRRQGRTLDVVDLGCGAGRNAVPLLQLGAKVTGTDLSWPMLEAAAARADARGLGGRLNLVLAPMDRLPLRDGSADVLVAHGIWNLAASATQCRDAVREAARVARPDTGLFVFTFSRNTLAPKARPVAGEPFVFTGCSGERQCFLTEEQLVQEMADAGFVSDHAVPLTEYNRPRPESLQRAGGPVIYEAAFRSGSAR